MDDAYFHALTSHVSAAKERPVQARRSSLLEQSDGPKPGAALERLPGFGDETSVTPEPPRAQIARRAQSYTDFYHVVTSRFTGAADLPTAPKQRRTSLSQKDASTLEWSSALRFDHEFSLFEAKLLDESHAVYETYHDQLLLSESHLENILFSTKTTLDLLSTISASFESVERQTDTFRQQCESLISEQRRIEALTDAIEENVRYYTYLEPMTRRLNAPGAANFVQGKDFPDMLSNLDNCLAYMEDHPKHKESATYRSRYRLLLTRALTLIRHHFTKSLGDIAADISKRIQAGQLKESTHSALLYAKFRVPAPELKALGVEIQKRAVPTPDDVDAGREPEYSSLMRELYESYSTTRGRLVLPLVSRKMAELAGTAQQTDVLAFSKATIGFMRGICLDEYELWYEWFETDGALYEFLETLMDPLFDYLRPRIIHETKLEKLCELCATIQGRYMDLDSDHEEEDDDDVGQSRGAIASPAGNGRVYGRKLDFGSLVQPALQDAQTRLVFLALNALRDGIEHYRAKPEDLEWPKQVSVAAVNGGKKDPVLSGRRQPPPTSPAATKPAPPSNDNAEDHLATLETSSQQWYPTLGKAISLLRRIYRLVNSTVFDDLAHRIVHSTIYSLITASQQVSAKKTVQDGQLFLITHLLHLKQQIVAFDIEFIPPEVEFDFSSVTNTFYELRERGSLWNPAFWARLVGGAVGGGLLPKVVENMLDAKAELDGRLRTVINDFVNGYAHHITAPLDPPTTSTGKAAKEEFDALKAVRTVRGLAEKDVPIIRAKLLEFVDDTRTRETLVAAVRDQVVMSYEDFFDTVSEGTGKRLSRKGKGREDEVLGPELFGEAMEMVFQAGRADDDNGDSGDSEGGNVSD